MKARLSGNVISHVYGCLLPRFHHPDGGVPLNQAQGFAICGGRL
jgi:hypothetical protein